MSLNVFPFRDTCHEIARGSIVAFDKVKSIVMNVAMEPQLKFKLIALLTLAILLASLENPFLKLIIEQGESLWSIHPNVISFCNVLFVGNTCAGLVPFLFRNPRTYISEIISAPLIDNLLLLLASFFVFLYPTFMFFALENSSVTNVVLISQVSAILYAFLGRIFLKISVTKLEIIGYSIIGICIFVLVLINNSFQVAVADLLIMLAAFSHAAEDVINKKLLEHFSIFTVISVTNILSACAFFIIANISYGMKHFAEVLTGGLWISMLIYGGVTITIAEYLWLKGIEKAPTSLIVNISLGLPMITVIAAFLLLGEIPSFIELLALIVISIGLVIANFDVKKVRSLFKTSVQM